MVNQFTQQLDPRQAQAISTLKDQLIVALINKLGGHVELDIKKLQDSHNYQLILQVDHEKQSLVYKTKKNNHKLAVQKTVRPLREKDSPQKDLQ